MIFICLLDYNTINWYTFYLFISNVTIAHFQIAFDNLKTFMN
jgi:hypothetical protein